MGEREVDPHAGVEHIDRVGSSRLYVHIDNLHQIGGAYGDGAQRAAVDHVRTVLRSGLRGRTQQQLPESFLRQVSENPVTYDGQHFHLAVSLNPSSDLQGFVSEMSNSIGSETSLDDWGRQYRADMELAVTLFDAMAEERLTLAWQPVCNADDPCRVLYYECLLRAVHADGTISPAAETIHALERLGLIRALDRYVMSKAIQELNCDPTKRLAVNVSARSMVDDYWWAGNLASLTKSPSIAKRLFVEVTESAPFPSLSDATDFVGRLRCLGCQIVLDDFGVGHAAVRTILTLAPDIVKIDKFFVCNAKASDAGLRTLVHIIGLAESLGAIVVVEGIESATDSRLVREAGGRWQQGFHLGRPSISRPWRLTSTVSSISSAAAGREDISGSVFLMANGSPLHRDAGSETEFGVVEHQTMESQQ
jgi:EAL domain-containing protein (putative c-di-GMP-specific phosphodiesterase class I)